LGQLLIGRVETEFYSNLTLACIYIYLGHTLTQVEAIGFAANGEGDKGRVVSVTSDGLRLWEWEPARCVEHIDAGLGKVGDVFIPSLDVSQNIRACHFTCLNVSSAQ
jgi:hypothetical protein